MRFSKGKFILFLTVCVLAVSVLYINLNRDIEKEEQRRSISTDNKIYTVKEYEGKVAVFEANSNSPLTVYESYVSLLPEYDRMLLKEGISVDNTEELQKIIEDYTS